MNQARVGLFVAAALVALPALASAQPKGAPKAQAGKNQPAGKDQPKGGNEQPKEINLDEAADPNAPVIDPNATPVAGGDEAGLGDICKIDPTACPTVDMDKAAARDMKTETYAVQQIYALRYHRFELNPYFGLTMNDQFVGHPGPGVAANFYITNVLGIGVNANVYAGLNSNSSFNLSTSRAARVGQPITEYQWNANANITYVPAYGKFAGFQDFIFHYDFFVLAGAGVISTRPIAVVDPDNRTFSFKPKPAGHLGGGLRIFVNRWLAATIEVSDYIFSDELENATVDQGLKGTCGKPAAQCDDTWIKGTSLTNNVQAQLGFSIFLPFTWEYRLPK